MALGERGNGFSYLEQFQVDISKLRRRYGRPRQRNRSVHPPTAELLEKRIVFGYGWNCGLSGGNFCPTCPTGADQDSENAGDAGGAGAPGGTGFSGGSAGGGGPYAGSSPTSVAPVRYLDGVPMITTTDLQSSGFGQTWGITRSWTGLNQAGQTGNGWQVLDQPYLNLDRNENSSHDGVVQMMDGEGRQERFNVAYSDGSISSLGGTQDQLSYTPPSTLSSAMVPGNFAISDEAGDVIRFSDLPRGSDGMLTSAAGYTQEATNQNSSTNYQYGRFMGETDAGGLQTSADFDATGQMSDMVRTDPDSGKQEGFFYTYGTYSNAEGGSESLVTEIDLKRRSSASDSWSTIQSAIYDYYTGDGSDSAYGRLGDLKTVTIENPGGVVVNQKYYRYYKVWSAAKYEASPNDTPALTGGSDSTYPEVSGRDQPDGGVTEVMSALRSVVEDASFSRLRCGWRNLSNRDACDGPTVRATHLLV